MICRELVLGLADFKFSKSVNVWSNEPAERRLTAFLPPVPDRNLTGFLVPTAGLTPAIRALRLMISTFFFLDILSLANLLDSASRVMHRSFEVVSPRRLGGVEATGEPWPVGDAELRDFAV